MPKKIRHTKRKGKEKEKKNHFATKADSRRSRLRPIPATPTFGTLWQSLPTVAIKERFLLCSRWQNSAVGLE